MRGQLWLGHLDLHARSSRSVLAKVPALTACTFRVGSPPPFLPSTAAHLRAVTRGDSLDMWRQDPGTCGTRQRAPESCTEVAG